MSIRGRIRDWWWKLCGNELAVTLARSEAFMMIDNQNKSWARTFAGLEGGFIQYKKAVKVKHKAMDDRITADFKRVLTACEQRMQIQRNEIAELRIDLKTTAATANAAIARAEELENRLSKLAQQDPEKISSSMVH